MDKNARIYVAGGETISGRAILAGLARRGYTHLIGGAATGPDLTDFAAVDAFFADSAPEYVFLAAGRSGGIGANRRYPAELMRDNLLVACHIIHCAWRHRVRKLLYLASSCALPRDCPQPMRENSLLTGPLEPTSEPYALAKIAGLRLCQAYRRQYGACFTSAIPANVFGPGDDFSDENSHVIAALIGRMHKAKISGASRVNIWGTGRPRREFIFTTDFAEACILVMDAYDDEEPINVGTGLDISIADLAAAVKNVTGFEGEVRFDASKPDGAPLKLLDSSRIKALGWQPRMPLRAALQETYDWFVQEGIAR